MRTLALNTAHKGSSVFKNLFMALTLAVTILGSAMSSAATTIIALATPENAAAPATVTFSVTVNADPDPAIVTKVEYFNGIIPLGVTTAAPFSFTKTNLAAGTYSIVAKATVENAENPVLVSEPTLLIITGNVVDSASVYYVQADHLNTPRAITDQSNTLVWSWESDPFGMLPPNEAPVSSMRFTFNPRFPGQYFDKESNLHYNYYRDYDPQTGRYVQSDPIGLSGGVNTYSYAGGKPLSYVDPTGEVAMVIPAAIAVGRIGFTAYRAFRVAKAIETAAKAAASSEQDQCNPCSQYPSRTEAYMQANNSAQVGSDWTAVGWDQYNKPSSRTDQIKYADFRSQIGSSPYGHRGPNGGEIVEHPADSDHKCPHFHAKKDLGAAGMVFPYDPEKG